MCYYLCFGERRRSFLLCEWVLSQVEPTDGFTEPGPWITAHRCAFELPDGTEIPFTETPTNYGLECDDDDSTTSQVQDATALPVLSTWILNDECIFSSFASAAARRTSRRAARLKFGRPAGEPGGRILAASRGRGACIVRARRTFSLS